MKKPWENENWSLIRNKLILHLSINYLFVYPTLIYLSVKFSILDCRFVDFPSMYPHYYSDLKFYGNWHLLPLSKIFSFILFIEWLMNRNFCINFIKFIISLTKYLLWWRNTFIRLTILWGYYLPLRFLLFC